MKLPFDENLSPRLARVFQIWIRLGNASTARIEEALRRERGTIDRLQADVDLAVLVI